MSTDSLHPISLNATWIPQALLLSKEAGWNQTASDWAVFFTHGTVLGFVIDDRLVATAAALPYGSSYGGSGLGWVSMVLVTAEWRRHGFATRLVSACTSVLRDAGLAALLDAAPAATAIYASLGYVPLCMMERWEGPGGGVAAQSDPVDLALDQSVFGADRSFLLEDFLSRPDSVAFKSQHGFTILRSGSVASQIGPIIAEPAEAVALVTDAIRAARGRVLVDVLDAGKGLVPTLTAHGFRPQRQFTRMALGLTELPGDSAKLLAAAGPEFG